ncbi:MAG: beta-lactamase family protein, partial [Flavisolibacter sp.]|nr:beta-lactamase family protein [Flavisolibacter sp.]
MKQLITTLTCLFLFLFSFAQTTEQKIDELLNAYVQLGKLNGTVLVAQGGEVVYQKGFGYRDAAGKILHTPESIFQIGSITKQFTAAVIMQLHQEKKLSVKDPLSKYFKGFVNGDKITVEHLLTHTSGLYNYTNDSVIMNNDVTQYYSQAKMVAIFQNYPADFEPGAKFNYSNSGYSMLGYIIEKVTRKPYEKVMRERIFQPLGMTHTGFDFTHLQHSNKSKGYFSITKDTAIAAPIVDSTIAHAAGAMYSTVADLLKWDRAVAAGKILSEASWKQVFTPHKSKYAYGWVIDSLHGRPVQGHSGGIHGFSSYILRFPKDDLAIIVIDNSSAPGGSIARNIGAILVGAPYKIPQAPKAVAM